MPSSSRSSSSFSRFSDASMLATSEPGQRHPHVVERFGQVDGRLPAELDHDPRVARTGFVVDDVGDALDVEGFKVKPVGSVEIGAHGLRVAVDHHRPPTALLQCPGRVHGAVVEFDSLSYPDRPRSDHDRRFAGFPIGLVLRLVGRIEIRRHRGEFGRAGVHQLVDRQDSEPLAQRAHPVGQVVSQLGDHRIREPEPLGVPEERGVEGFLKQPQFHCDQVFELGDEEPVDGAQVKYLLDAAPAPQRRQDRPQALVVGMADGPVQYLAIAPGGVLPQHRAAADLQRTKRLADGPFDAAFDRHHLAGRLHLGPQRAVGGREFVERPARDLGDHVVQRRLERGRGFAGDRVGQFVEAESNRDLGRNARDRVAGSLGGQRRRAAHARVHLDHPVLERIRVQGQLDVAAPGDVQGVDDLQRRAAQELVLLVREGLARGENDRVPGMHPHRVEVLHVADGHAGPGRIAHDLVFDLFPAGEVLLDQHLSDRGGIDPLRHQFVEAARVLGDPAPGAAQGVGRPDDQRKAQTFGDRTSLADGVGDVGPGDRLIDAQHQAPKQVPVLCLPDRRDRRAQQSDAVALQDPGFLHLAGQVEPGLPAQRGQQSVGPLAPDDPLDHLHRERFDVDHVGHVLVGHDRGRIGIDQDGRDPFLADRFAGLGAGVVELGRLPDHDRGRSR